MQEATLVVVHSDEGEVGYASENRFRSAFKKLCGLSPRSWRETFLPVKLIFLGWLMQNQEFVDSLGAFIA